MAKRLNQSLQSMSMQEGENISMSCGFSSIFNTLIWYKQDAGEGPVFLITLYKGGELARNGILTAQFDKTRKENH